MRDIKFRAYDKNNSAMFKIKVINFLKRFVSMEDYPFGDYLNGIDAKRSNGTKIENLEIMQYTGLKDKNGVEIYEGDIVKNDRSKNTFTIVFKDGTFILTTNENRAYKDLRYCYMYSEVIGNIYENKSLLK